MVSLSDEREGSKRKRVKTDEGVKKTGLFH